MAQASALARTASVTRSASSSARLAGTRAMNLFGSVAANKGLASVALSNQGAPIASKRSRHCGARPSSQRSTAATPRKLGNNTASGPNAVQTTAKASHTNDESRCEPAHKSEVERAWAMKPCTGPKLMVKSAGSSSSTIAPLSAETMSRCCQML